MINYIYGINTTISAIESKRVKRVFLQPNFRNDKLLKLLSTYHISCETVERKKLDSLTNNANHQGVVAETIPYKTKDMDALIKNVSSKEKSILVMLDGIEDPHNLGAILRICDAFSIDGIIYKNAHQVGLNDTVAKVSTGAINYVDVYCVSNLSNAISALKENGFWIYASDGEADNSYKEIDYANKSCIIIGSEGFGISRLVKENSDVLIKIPMTGHVNSLNASTAAAIIVSEVCFNINVKHLSNH